MAYNRILLPVDGSEHSMHAVAHAVSLVREGGEIVDEVAPGSGVFACMLGGADGRTLFLCCAPDFDEQARTAAREAEIRAITVNTPRAGLP